ncbi:MSMEG_0570 family nitrogen starvation response protein [Marinobacterium mangrovicola]|uniref:Putative repeat protein (TIGR04042 family) n=1 Tax=Marinobacterium mangrovicola TaxID=1476959 RepID=A0A4R1GL43_9GAMM|nr:MSMEG_0570 family nitrogen starvation response protein [Marinobacterium mangrovicola]TCK09154.1 putative repeat protein (TIGR04042 family) [Marinobacterium mangrovicola]
MPAINFNVRWPDGSEDSCYSPSTVVRDHFKTGDKMPLAEFVSKAEVALDSASHRVEQKFGYFCSSAMDQLSVIKAKAARFETSEHPEIEITHIS